jgi:hypothetical protein
MARSIAILARLNNSDLFGRARIADYGTAVAWDDDDLPLDAVHLDLPTADA